MASDSGRSIFRAIADFSALRREAKATSKDLGDLKDKTGKSSDGLKDHEKQTDKSSSALGRFGAALSSARKKLDDFGNSNAGKALDGLEQRARGLIGTITSLVATFAKISLIALVAQAAVGPVMSLVGAIGALSGVVGVLPGILAAATIGVGALKIAFSGVDEVMGTILTQDAKKFEEAIKGMPPAMQQAMRAAYALGPALNTVKKAVQENFWQGLNKVIAQTGKTYIPMVGNALVAAARGANTFVKEIGAFLAKKDTVEAMRAGFARVGDAFGRLKGTGTAVASVFTDIFSISTRFLGPLADGIKSAAEKFAAFIHTAATNGSLEKWIQTGIDQFKALMGAIKNVGSIIFSVFKAAGDAGAGFFKTLERVTGELADFLKSAEGQTALRDLFDAAQRAAGVLMPIVKAVLSTLADIVPILVSFGEKIGPGVEKVIRGIGVAFETAKPGLDKLGVALGRFLDALGDAGPLVGSLANGVSDVLSPVIDALTWLIKTLVDIFNSLPKPVQDVIGQFGGLVIAAGLGVLAFKKVIDITKTFVGAFDTVAGAIKAAISKLADWLKLSKEAKAADLGGDFLDGGGVDGKKKKGGKLGKVAGALGVAGAGALAVGELTDQYANAPAIPNANGAKIIPGANGSTDESAKNLLDTGLALDGLSKKLTDIKQPFLDFSVWLSQLDLKKPFLDFSVWLSTTAIPAIKQPFLDFGVWLSGKWTEISEGISAAWNGIGEWLSEKWTAITDWAKETWQGLSDWWDGLWAGISEKWNAFWSGIGEFFSGLWDSISNWAKEKWQALSDWWDGLWASISEKWNAFWGGIGEFFSGLWDSISAKAQEVWNAFWAWLSGLWNDITTGLKASWESIRQGAVDAWNAVTNAIRTAVNAVGDWLKQRWDDIKNWLNNLWVGLKTQASQLWTGIKDAITGAIQSVKDILSGIWNGITTGVSNAWENIKRIVGDAVSWVKQRISDIGDGLGNAVSWVGGLVGIGRNKGGIVPGSGPDRDSVPLMATPGEFVSTRKATKEHRAQLEAWNRDAGGNTTMASSDIERQLMQNAAGASGVLDSQVSGMAGVSASGGAPVRPAVSSGVQVGSVTVIQNVSNPLPEKPSVSLTKRVARLSSLGLEAAMAGA
jgi:phage-related protein